MALLRGSACRAPRWFTKCVNWASKHAGRIGFVPFSRPAMGLRGAVWRRREFLRGCALIFCGDIPREIQILADRAFASSRAVMAPVCIVSTSAALLFPPADNW